MPLTDVKIKNAKGGTKPDGSLTEKSYKLTDEKGLYLEVAPSGGKWWRLKYRFGGKEKRLSLGVYPDVSLKEARNSRDEIRKQLASGIDPSAARKSKKIADAGLASFESVAREWHQKQKPVGLSNTAKKPSGVLKKKFSPGLVQKISMR